MKLCLREKNGPVLRGCNVRLKKEDESVDETDLKITDLYIESESSKG